jgi:hypothetical protein
MPNPRWKIKPAGSTWGDFGPDDQLGRLNLVTPEKVKQGVAEVHEGLSFCLSMPLDYPGGSVLNPRRNPPRLAPTTRSGKPNMVYPLSRDDPRLVDVVCDDVVLLTLQYSTQWDSLAHVGQQFDVDGDGKREMCSTTASAPARTSAGRSIIATARRSRPASTWAPASLAWRTWHAPACRAAP